MLYNMIFEILNFGKSLRTNWAFKSEIEKIISLKGYYFMNVGLVVFALLILAENYDFF